MRTATRTILGLGLVGWVMAGGQILRAQTDPPVIFSTYLGGSDLDVAVSVAVDTEGSAYVTGITTSADFPVVNGLGQEEPEYERFPIDSFVTKFAPDGSVVYSTYLIGSPFDIEAFDIAMGLDGSAYVAGSTDSGGDVEAFVARILPDGTFGFFRPLSGDNVDRATGIVVDAQGFLLVTGYTVSSNFPRDGPVGPGDFRVKLSPFGDFISAQNLGSGGPSVFGSEVVAVDPWGDVYTIRTTDDPDLPTINAFQPFYAGGEDAFITKIDVNRAPDCSAAFASPSTIWPPNGRMVPISIRGVTDPDGDPVTLTVRVITQDEPLTKPGVPDSSGIGTPTAQVRAARDGKGDGRVYQIRFEARDDAGGVCTETVTVCVPHDQGRGRSCGSAR